MAELKARIKHKIGTPDEWSQATNFSPLKGELVVYNDATNPRMKIGDGETNVNDLPFINNAFVTVNLDGAGNGEDFVPDDNLVINAETLGGKPASSYMLKTDIATNSSKLGGKPPEAYTAVNLLINSDWRVKENIVNQRGLDSYVGSGIYTIDQWRHWGHTTIGLVINNGYITVGNAISQDVPRKNINPGMEFTIGYKTRSNVIMAFPFSVGDVGTTVTVGNINIALTNSVLSITINGGEYQWAALYEGTYTAETLPPYVPSHKRVESLKIGLPIQPVNLLDNSWFGGRYVGDVKEGLIYQAGLNGLHGTTKYPMDRWISWNLDAGFADGYITVNSPYDQRLDPNKIDANKVYTVAACFADGTITCSSGVASANIGGYANIGLYLNYNNGAPYVRMWHNGADTYRWAALYEGAYTAETLPPYVPKGYAAELLECQRYYYQYPNDTSVYGYTGSGGTSAYMIFELPAVMRLTNPTVSLGDRIYAAFGGAGTLQLTSISSSTIVGKQLQLVMPLPSTQATNTICAGWTSKVIAVSADL